ncbi:family 10 glycosylhydrolase [candidate division KSB1 bacterium]|nr:family 10 glycosylhydrolase [candidate division KSB1 bacterium]
MDKDLKMIIILFFLRIFLHPWDQVFSDRPQDEVPEWTRTARLVGVSYDYIEDAEPLIDWAAQSGASVLDIDVGINNYYHRFLNPDEGITLLKVGCDLAHERGLKAFTYLSGFEMITKGAARANGTRKKTVATPFTEHPDWLQTDQNGEPAVFLGSQAFWLEAEDESAWATPLNPEWRKQYMYIVERVVRETAVDGIFIDVSTFMTHFDGWSERWPSFDPYMIAEFKKYGGQWPFNVGDFTDKNFQHWLQFRYQIIQQFLDEVRQTIRKVRRDVVLINESYPGGLPDAVCQGTDPYYNIKSCDLITHEWEPADKDALNRKEYGWLFYAAGIELFRELDNNRPRWIITYVNTEADLLDQNGSNATNEALLNLAGTTVLSGANYWECGSQNMINTSTNINLRKDIFKWVQENQKYLYDYTARPLDAIGIYYSPTTRDVADQSWWGIHQSSCYGLAMGLLENHYTYQFITPRSIAKILPTQVPVIILANVAYLSNDERQALANYLKNGGKILVYGEDNDLYHLDGTPRTGNPLAELKSVPKAQLLIKAKNPGYDYFYGTILSPSTEAYIYPNYPVTKATNASLELANDLKSLNYQPYINVESQDLISFRLESSYMEDRIYITNFTGMSKNKAPSATGPIKLTYQANYSRYIDATSFMENSLQINHQFNDATKTETITIESPNSWRGIVIRLRKVNEDQPKLNQIPPDSPHPVNFFSNYPNPVRNENETTLVFQFTNFNPNRLVIYDLLGRKINELPISFQASGEMHSVKWDLKDDRGMFVANGVYFACLQNSARKEIRRLLVMR